MTSFLSQFHSTHQEDVAHRNHQYTHTHTFSAYKLYTNAFLCPVAQSQRKLVDISFKLQLELYSKTKENGEFVVNKVIVERKKGKFHTLTHKWNYVFEIRLNSLHNQIETQPRVAFSVL